MSHEPLPLQHHPHRTNVAYFSMEIGLDASVPTYAGGLGILAGDTIRAAADLGIAMVGVTLVHRHGYFDQRLDETGWQVEEPVRWDPAEHLVLETPHAVVRLEGRDVRVRAWRYDVTGIGGHVVPVFLLDTDFDSNSEPDREITRHLYAGDAHARLRQEAVLGIGGVRMLRALGWRRIDHFHMNEGHAALLTLELLREESEARGLPPENPSLIEPVRRMCVFTTHTPVAAGHDKFNLDLVRSVIDGALLRPLANIGSSHAIDGDGLLNMTFLGFSLSRYINGVARRHGAVSRALFGQYPIDSITNGVHAATWVAPSMAELFDRRLPGWREDNSSLRSVRGIGLGEIRTAHELTKRALVDLVREHTGVGFDPGTFTIGFARRATAYKRAELLLADTERLVAIARANGGLQIVFAGKAHPRDHSGKELIQRIVRVLPHLQPEIRAVYLPNYDMRLARVLIPGVDLWLNTPQPPLEASGTSGMKAALNGVPSLSTLDGWWLEGHIEGVTGWAIGSDDWTSGHAVDQFAAPSVDRNAADAASLYDLLDRVILPMYRHDADEWGQVMRNAIALNGSFFNTHRMMQQYVLKAYFL